MWLEESSSLFIAKVTASPHLLITPFVLVSLIMSPSTLKCTSIEVTQNITILSSYILIAVVETLPKWHEGGEVNFDQSLKGTISHGGEDVVVGTA